MARSAHDSSKSPRLASLNGRPYKLLIDSSVDLAKASYGFFRIPSWIIPLEEGKQTGGYPDNADELRREIQEVFESEVQPILKKVKRNKFNKPVDEFLEQVLTEEEQEPVPAPPFGADDRARESVA